MCPKRFHTRVEAKEYLPYFKESVQFLENVRVSLETMPVGELPKMKLH